MNTATNPSVLISGAGIGGPALAHWLSRYGYAVTVVEQAPHLRASGAAVDFRGDQLALLERMGILDDLRALETHMGEQLIVDERGQQVSKFPSALFSGELEIARGDLAQVLYGITRDSTEYLFGDRVTSVTQGPDGADVTFQRSAPRRFDLVVGADGTHSGVRRAVFGDESRFRHDLGYNAVGFTMPNTFGLDHLAWVYNEPGRYVNVSSARDRTRAAVAFVFEAPDAEWDRRDGEGQKRRVAQAYAGAGWRVPELLSAMRHADDVYFDSLAQIRMDTWSAGRVTLLGDAAWSAGPGGHGTGHAMLGAYTLAGELAAAGGDHVVAFARYDEIMRPIVEKSQKFAAKAGSFLAPPTDRKIRNRNRAYRVLSSKVLSKVFDRLANGTADTGDLKEYPQVAGVR